MSAILDALRRARGGGAVRPASIAPRPTAAIPAGLRVGGSTKRPTPKAPGATRWGLVWGVVAFGAIAWAGVQFGLPLLKERASAPRVVALSPAEREARAAAQASTPADDGTSGLNVVVPATGATPVDASGPAPSAEGPPIPGRGGTPSINEMIGKIQAPADIAPRAMPGVRPSPNAPGTTPPASARLGLPAPGFAAGGAAAPSAAAHAATGATASVDAAAVSAPRVAAPRPAPRPAATAAPARRPLPAAPVATLTEPAISTPVRAPGVNHFDLALRYHSLGNFEQALTHYTAVLQAEEFNVEARNNLGLLYMDRGLTAEAIQQFKRAILINPEYLKARSNLAVALMNSGRLAEARAELRAALAIDPRNVDLLVNMALVEKADRRTDLAKETLMRALGFQPTHPAAHYNLAVLYDESGELGHAYDHYADFLKSAGPEYGVRLSDVRRRMDAIAPPLAALPR